MLLKHLTSHVCPCVCVWVCVCVCVCVRMHTCFSFCFVSHLEHFSFTVCSHVHALSVISVHLHRLWMGWRHPLQNWLVDSVHGVDSIASVKSCRIFNFSCFNTCVSQLSCGYTARANLHTEAGLIQSVYVICEASRKKFDWLFLVWRRKRESSVTICPQFKMSNFLKINTCAACHKKTV